MNINYDVIKQMMNGAGLSFCVAGLAGPLDYLKDMKLLKEEPKLRNCFQGVNLVMINDIPAASVAFSINHLLKNWINNRNDGEPLTKKQKVLSAAIAGSASGLVITPGTNVVSNYRRHKGKITMTQIAKNIHAIHGVKGFMNAAMMVAMRECMFASSYLILTEIINDQYSKVIKNPNFCLAASALTSGAIGGALTTPIDTLRLVRQPEGYKKKQVTSYKKLIKDIGIGRLFKRFYFRSFSVSFACLLYVEGRKYFFS